MRVNHLKIEYDTERKPCLVKEKSANCPQMESRLCSPDTIADFCRYYLRMDMQTEEYVYMLAFNTKCDLIGIFQVSHGNIDSSHCSPREIIRNALMSNAKTFVVVHNHPSGDCTPSESDIKVYKNLTEAGKLMELTLMDSIIIGNGDYYSFREHP